MTIEPKLNGQTPEECANHIMNSPQPLEGIKQAAALVLNAQIIHDVREIVKLKERNVEDAEIAQQIGFADFLEIFRENGLISANHVLHLKNRFAMATGINLPASGRDTGSRQR